jgi:predicted dienelactone hydrolase
MSWRKDAAIPFPNEAIGVKTLHYKDSVRDRPVLVEFWYPTDQRQGTYEVSEESVWIHPKELRNVEIAGSQTSYPLIMMSHGNRGDRRERTWLVEALVRQGFVVASVEHHGNAWYHYNPLSSFCFWDRAKDITFALNSLLQDPNFQDRIDRDRIGFVGYSMGGMTGLALAGAQASHTREIAKEQCSQLGGMIPESVVDGLDFVEAEKNYEDPRIRAMLLICPAAFVYQPFALQKIKIPVGLIVSLDDEVLPYNDHADKIIKNTAIRKLKIMKNKTSHYAFLNRITDRGNLILQKAFDVSTAHRWTAIHEEATQFALQFFKETLPSNEK